MGSLPFLRSPRLSLAAGLFFGVLFIQGCNPEIITTHSEGGALCLVNKGEEPKFDAEFLLVENTPKRVKVQFDDCASGCTRILSSACTAIVQDTTIQVRAKVETSLPRDPNQPCPTVCVPVEAQCDLQGTLLAGVEYILSDGTQNLPVKVPGKFTCVSRKPNSST